jgi:hypothetical protein
MQPDFQPKFVDLVRNVSTTTGIGDFQLGPAISGFNSFLTACQIGDSFYYSAIGLDRPSEREVGRGTLLAGGAISRDPIGGAKTNFSNGSKSIALIAAAEWFNSIQAGAGGSAAGSGVGAVADRSALASLAQRQFPVFLSEAGSAGLFVFDAADFTAQVAADLRQAICVAPTSDVTGASGAWVRRFSGPINVQWFGAAPSAAAAINNAAFQAALSYCEATGSNSFAFTQGVGGGSLFVPRGVYNLSATLDIRSTVTIQGEGGHDLSEGSTVLAWTAGATGIRIQRYNTSGDATTGPVTHNGGDGTILKNLWLQGGYSGAEGEFHGVHAKARFRAESVVCRNWQGDGFHIVALSGSPTMEGNANSWHLDSCVARDCRNGLFLDGDNTNAGISIGFNASLNRQWGICDSSFLTNQHIAYHLEGNGKFTGNKTVCTFAGNIYYVIPGQEAWCAANAPSGGTADNQGWGWLEPGGTETGQTSWTAGLTWRAGGPICTDNPNAAHVVTGYVEGGQAPAMLAYPTLALGNGAKEYGTTKEYGASLAVVTSPGGLKMTGPITAAGSAKVGGRLELTGQGVFGGQSGPIIYKDASDGCAIIGWGGANNDLNIFDAGGSSVARIPHGSRDWVLSGGDVSVPAAKGLRVGGVKVVSAQQPAITNDASGAANQATINAILSALRAHGLIAP